MKIRINKELQKKILIQKYLKKFKLIFFKFNLRN